MNFTYSNSLEFSLQICLMFLKQFIKKLKVTDDFINLGCLLISFKIFVLNIIVFLCILCSLSYFVNFSFCRNGLNTFPWCCATDIMRFLFVRRISSYFFMISAASSGFSTLSAFSFNSPASILSLITRESISYFFISSVTIFLSSWRFQNLSTATNKI